MDKTLNCWEYMVCGREIGGARVNELGLCPAAIDTRFNGIHGGRNAGRACWVVAGTLCKGTVQGTYAKKYKGYCWQCDFYTIVKKEECDRILPTIFLLNILEAGVSGVPGASE
jgi:hypothetical protein